jgi:ribonuclease P protein component
VSTPPPCLDPLPLATIKKRADFLRVRGGAKWSGRGFLIDCRKRPAAEGETGARFGFTVTKKMQPSAVARNRIRRRLKEAVRLTQGSGAVAGFDYVVVARLPAADMPFEALCRDLITAFGRLHRPAKILP